MPENNGAAIERSLALGLLASSLGDQKARLVWDEALHRLGIPGVDSYSPAQAKAMLDALAATEGIVGVAARFARLRLGLDDARSSPPGRPTSSDRRTAAQAHGGKPTAGAAFAGKHVDLHDLFAPALGEDKAREAVATHARRLGLDVSRLTRREAIDLLDAMAKVPGLIGVVANFAKVTFLLRNPD